MAKINKRENPAGGSKGFLLTYQTKRQNKQHVSSLTSLLSQQNQEKCRC